MNPPPFPELFLTARDRHPHSTVSEAIDSESVGGVLRSPFSTEMVAFRTLLHPNLDYVGFILTRFENITGCLYRHLLKPCFVPRMLSEAVLVC
jgi:hypothetical protein